MPSPIRFFVYGSHLSGEPEHDRLAGADLVGPCRTVAGYTLVELGAMAALIAEGAGSVVGEVYAAPHEVVGRLAAQHPGLFRLHTVQLDDGSKAEALVIDSDLARGKRRVKDGDWRARFGPKPRAKSGGALVEWAKRRHR